MSSKHKIIWPCPVYVAKLSSGDTVRVALTVAVGKPIDFAQGRRIAATRIIDDGQVEHAGQVTPDPHFAPVAPAIPSQPDALALLRRAAQLVVRDASQARTLAMQAADLLAAA